MNPSQSSNPQSSNPIKVYNARDIYRKVPNAWEGDEARSVIITEYGNYIGDVVQLRLSWCPPMTPEEWAKTVKKGSLLDPKSSVPKARKPPTGNAKSGLSASGCKRWHTEDKNTLIDHEQMKEAILGGISAKTDKLIKESNILGVMGRWRESLAGNDAKAFWDEYSSRKGDYWIVEEQGAQPGAKPRKFVVSLIEDRKTHRPLFDKDAPETRYVSAKQGGRSSIRWTPEIERKFEEKPSVIGWRRENAKAEDWRFFVWVKVIKELPPSAMLSGSDGLCGILISASMRISREKIMAALDGSYPVKKSDAEKNGAKSSYSSSDTEAQGRESKKFEKAEESNKPKKSDESRNLMLAPVLELTPEQKRQEKFDRLLYLLDNLSFPEKSRATTTTVIDNSDSDNHANNPKSSQSSAAKPQTTAAAAKQDIEDMYLTLGISGRPGEHISDGKHLPDGSNLIKLILELAKELAAEKSIDFYCTSINLAKNFRTELHVDDGFNIIGTHNFQMTLGNYKDPNSLTCNQGRTFLAHQPFGKSPLSASYNVNKEWISGLSADDDVSASSKTKSSKPSSSNTASSNSKPGNSAMVIAPKTIAQSEKTIAQNEQNGFVKTQSEQNGIVKRPTEDTMVARHVKFNPSTRSGWSKLTGIHQNEKVEGYYVDSHNTLIEFPASYVAHMTEAFPSYGKRYNITFYTRKLNVGVKDKQTDIRARKLLHLEYLGFPITNETLQKFDGGFKISDADRKKWGATIGDYDQNPNQRKFNIRGVSSMSEDENMKPMSKKTKSKKRSSSTLTESALPMGMKKRKIAKIEEEDDLLKADESLKLLGPLDNSSKKPMAMGKKSLDNNTKKPSAMGKKTNTQSAKVKEEVKEEQMSDSESEEMGKKDGNGKKEDSGKK